MCMRTSAHDDPFKIMIRPMTMSDYDAVIGLMKQTPGVSIRDADSREATELYLQRNPGLSFVAEESDTVVGCVMSGHDGRRGYLQHLVVLPAYRNRGIASALVERCLAGLEGLGILKTHIDVLETNAEGQQFWQARGWSLRTDICRYSFVRSGGASV
jgi:ribosomal protein S18 acetylase RimI-like enzyme